MATGKILYGTSNQPITITATTLASSATVGRSSLAVDNTTNLFLDAAVMVKVTMGATTPANDKAIYVYAYGTADGGTTYSENNTGIGTDASYTIDNPTNLIRLGVILVPTASISYAGGPWSVASALGFMPAKWGIVVVNFTGDAFTACSAHYQGIQSTVV